MIYNAKNGYGLKLTKFDEQYEDCIIYRKTKREIIRLADNIMRAFDRKGLMVVGGMKKRKNLFQMPLTFIKKK